MHRGKIILAVTKSDAHVVANHLLSHLLRENDFEVINLGPCTSIEELYASYLEHSDCLAIALGSLNGHAYEDLEGLRELKAKQAIQCPVFLGGNLSVGSQKSGDEQLRFQERGVDLVLETPEELLNVLETMPMWSERESA